MDSMSSNSSSFRQKLKNIPIRRKGSVATGVETEDPVSSINLLELPNEILDSIFNHVGVKNFYEDPIRLAVCKKWHNLVRLMMVRSVELDVNSLVRVVSLARPSLVRKILRKDVSDDNKIGLRLDAIQNFDADLRIINGFITKNNVPIQRNSNYKQWKIDVDSSFEWLSTHMHELATVRSFRLRVWTAACLIAERKDRTWRRLSRDAVADLQMSPSVLDSVELDFCGTDFLFTRCGFKENSSGCLAISRLLPRVRSLRLRLQEMCPMALQLPETNAKDMRLEELIVNRDISEAKPWGQCGAEGGLCMRPDGLSGLGYAEIVQAMRLWIPRMRRPRMVRFLWMNNKFETLYDANFMLPVNKEGKVVYRGSMAYDLLTEKVQRLKFLAPWDSEGAEISGCNGHLWEKKEGEDTEMVGLG